ncbi:phosphoribosylaminoimidazolesuccinocarboxamide synthase [bacterium]|jgi:phosphoribosylaminoimidazole-succinocarboxamide synthase|nr:phosphoribosylaminoimidazolesuccinocarboxamide synthase [bacterium]
MPAMDNINLSGIKKFKSGKVREIYDLGDKLLILTSDRISAFDCIMPNPIPDKGKLLTAISVFWFNKLYPVIENHIITTDIEKYPPELKKFGDIIKGRSMLVKKCSIIPIECVVRGYLAGSGLKEYDKKQTVCGIKLPKGLKSYSKLPEPVFTPSTKAESGHDENITVKKMIDVIGKETSDFIISKTMEIYKFASDLSLNKGLILADTKFEFGVMDNSIILCDEVLTPDSSRYWLLSGYREGEPQENFDKQFLRDYLETLDWDKKPPAPALPEKVISKTREKYIEAYEKLTGNKWL